MYCVYCRTLIAGFEFLKNGGQSVTELEFHHGVEFVKIHCEVSNTKAHPSAGGCRICGLGQRHALQPHIVMHHVTFSTKSSELSGVT